MKKHFSYIASSHQSLLFVTILTMAIIPIFVLPAFASAAPKGQQSSATLRLEQFSSETGALPCDETSTIIRDREGAIWIGTRLGVNRYDGHQLTTFKNDIKRPHLFTSADIKSLADDGKGHLWLGTFSGLNRMDKRTGAVRQFHFDRYGGSDYIKSVFCNGNDVWVGNDNGLYLYDQNRKRFRKLRGREVPTAGVETIVMDSHGYIWVGTTGKGLFRYHTSSRQWTRMPKINSLNSAKTVAEDKQGNLWIGSYGCGLQLIKHPRGEKHEISITTFDKSNSLITCDYINALALRHEDQSLWIGTNDGLTVRRSNGRMSDIPDNKNDKWKYMSRGVNSIIAGSDGQMWMCVNNGGVVTAGTKRCAFSTFYMTPPLLPDRNDIVNCIVAEDKGNSLWMGLNNCGIATRALHSGKTMVKKLLPTAKDNSAQSEVNSVTITRHGILTVGTRKNGMLMYKDGVLTKQFYMGNSKWLKDNCVYGCVELDDGSIIAGTWKGLCRLRSNGKGMDISHIGKTDISKLHILNILRTGKNDYWLALIFGIVHITGDINHPEGMKATVYSHEGKQGCASPRDANRTVTATDDKRHYHLGGIFKMVRDRNGRIWACTSEPGLLQYDMNRDAFVSVSRKYGIRGDNVHSMEEDRMGDLWMSTNYGIARLRISDDGRHSQLDLFSTTDGLPESYYGNAVSCKTGDGRICFANNNSVTVFDPAELANQKAVGNGMTDGEQLSTHNADSTPWTNGQRMVVIAIIIILIVIIAYFAYNTFIRRTKQNGETNTLQQEAPDGNAKGRYVVELPDIHLTDTDKEFIRKCTEVVQQHLSNSEFDQQMLMREMGTSHATLYRKMKALTGMDATAFIRNMRLKTACAIMDKNQEIRVSDLAYYVGYGNPKYFATCFKNEFGMSPSEYMEKKKSEKTSIDGKEQSSTDNT